jgi:cap2 methyltransferase
VDLEYARVIGPDFGLHPYSERAEGKKYVRTEHWGQRKLFVSEVEFLQKCVPRDAANVVVIYAGAGPGKHLSLLSDMFPSYTFVLIDPVKIEVPVVENRVIIHQCYFTDRMAHELKRAYAGSTLFFISDIRPDLKGEPEDEKIIMKNMEEQAAWHFILGGKSMLKFRLPYTAGTTSYLKGELLLPVWGPQSTTECRLVVDPGCGYQEYDHGVHEQRMSYFNKVARPALYPHGVRGCGLDHCYDCTAEINILRDYLGSADISIVRDFFGVDASDEGIAAFSSKISSAISGGTQTLASRIEQRRREGAKTSVMRGRIM